MELDEISLSRLRYDRTKITLSLLPVMRDGRTTFAVDVDVRRNYAFAPATDGVVPCFREKHQVSRMAFADVYRYEQIRVQGDYGTYSLIPKTVPPESLNRFTLPAGGKPVFEGYFDSLYAANMAYAGLLPFILGRVLPFERVKDERLETELKGLDFTEYGYDEYGGDGEEE